jgi:hypothetical protein
VNMIARLSCYRSEVWSPTRPRSEGSRLL